LGIIESELSLVTLWWVNMFDPLHTFQYNGAISFVTSYIKWVKIECQQLKKVKNWSGSVTMMQTTEARIVDSIMLLLNRFWSGWLFKGVALQYILYSDLHPLSKCKSKVKVGFWKVKGQTLISPLYSTTDTFTDSCVNITLQKFTRNRTSVKHDF